MTIQVSVLTHLKDVMPYKWKVQSARSWGCECVAYIDARQVMETLDEIMGPENWQDSYRGVGRSVYCDLSLRVNGEWITKSDCGSESNFEGEKGQASDAFKRAAVKWGIGRFLYSLPTKRVKAIENGKDERGKPRYVPADDQGRKIRDLTAHLNADAARNTPPQGSDSAPKTGAANTGYVPKTTPQDEPEKTPTGGTVTQIDNAQAPDEAKAKIEALCKRAGLKSEDLGRMLRDMHTSYKRLKLSEARRLIADLEAMLNAS